MRWTIWQPSVAATCWSSCRASAKFAKRPKRCASTIPSERGNSAAVCAAVGRRTGACVQAIGARPADRAGDQRCRNVADGARHRYVIDTGLARVKRYSYRNKVEQLQVEPISQAAANQRAGRCGRVADGDLHSSVRRRGFRTPRPQFTDPEMLRSSLAAVILRMKSLAPRRRRDVSLSRAAAGARDRRRLPAAGRSWARSTTRNDLTPLGRELAKSAARSARWPHDPGRA